MDITAILVMLILAWSGVVKPSEAFSGLSSNAVVSIIGVMILGYGIEKSGVMKKIVKPILDIAGKGEKRLIGFVSLVIGGLSAFLQNIGAAALFLPAIIRISKRTRIPASRLLMPMGFAAILGGTLSMVGSGPLIILNDLLKQSGEESYGLFSVTPLGVVLLATGIMYFLFFGKYVFPGKDRRENDDEMQTGVQQQLIETWHLQCTTYECIIPEKSSIIAKTREDAGICKDYGLNLIAMKEGDEVLYAPWRYARFAAGQRLVLIGRIEDVERFASDFSLNVPSESRLCDELERPENAGFAELIIPPKAPVAGKTLREIALRKSYHVEPIILLSGENEERGDFSDRKFEVGDALIVYGLWEHIKTMGDNHNFVLITPVEVEISRQGKPVTAAACFLAAVIMVIFGVQLSVALFSGALAMALLGVIKIDEAYRAVDWRTVFLLAGLIPLGIAMEKSGAAEYTAGLMMNLLKNSHPMIILMAFSALAGLFSLFMSNVAATVLLVPLVMTAGRMTGLDPRAMALLVAVSASNSFILPTHQVNALLMSPGGYRNKDYIKAGGIMTLLFLFAASGIIYLFYM